MQVYLSISIRQSFVGCQLSVDSPQTLQGSPLGLFIIMHQLFQFSPLKAKYIYNVQETLGIDATRSLRMLASFAQSCGQGH